MFQTSQVRPSYNSGPKFSSPVAENSDKIGTRPSSLKDFQVTPKIQPSSQDSCTKVTYLSAP